MEVMEWMLWNDEVLMVSNGGNSMLVSDYIYLYTSVSCEYTMCLYNNDI